MSTAFHSLRFLSCCDLYPLVNKVCYSVYSRHWRNFCSPFVVSIYIHAVSNWNMLKRFDLVLIPLKLSSRACNLWSFISILVVRVSWKGDGTFILSNTSKTIIRVTTHTVPGATNFSFYSLIHMMAMFGIFFTKVLKRAVEADNPCTLFVSLLKSVMAELLIDIPSSPTGRQIRMHS